MPDNVEAGPAGENYEAISCLQQFPPSLRPYTEPEAPVIAEPHGRFSCLPQQNVRKVNTNNAVLM
jgi:hypothetical protein